MNLGNIEIKDNNFILGTDVNFDELNDNYLLETVTFI